MIDALHMQYRPDIHRIEVLFAIQPDTVAKLEAALNAGRLKTGAFVNWDGEPGGWFCGYLYDDANEEFEIGADYETGEIRLAAWPEEDRLDHTAPPLDMNEQWVKFVSPMKRLMDILQ